MSKNQKEALGKGIRALLQDLDTKSPAKRAFPEDEEEKSKETKGISNIRISNIEVNPFQPRADFDEEALNDLAESIKIHGVIQPITVRELGNGKYQLIAGERRTRASSLAGMNEIPAYVREANDQEMLEIALIENIQREDLNALEVALNYDRLLQECSLTQEQLAKRIGKSRSAITNFLRLLKLAPGVQSAIKEGAISMGHGRALLGLDSFNEQEEACIKVIEQGLNVRQTEKLIQQAKQPKEKKKKSEISAEWVELRNMLTRRVGASTNIRSKGNGKGEIVIQFKNEAELNSIIDRLEE